MDPTGPVPLPAPGTLTPATLAALWMDKKHMLMSSWLGEVPALRSSRIALSRASRWDEMEWRGEEECRAERSDFVADGIDGDDIVFR